MGKSRFGEVREEAGSSSNMYQVTLLYHHPGAVAPRDPPLRCGRQHRLVDKSDERRFIIRDECLVARLWSRFF